MATFSSHIFHFPFCIKEKPGYEKFKTVIAEHWAQVSRKKTVSYNEYVYFYEQIRNVFFPEKNKEDICWYFEKSIPESSTYNINVKNDKTYELLIKKISLRIFNSSTGILSINLHNSKYEQLEEIIKINEFGRRIYPQYLDPQTGVDLPFGTKGNFLADSVTVKIGGKQIEEKFPNENYNENEIIFPEHIKYLLGYEFVDQYKPCIIIDDRMFTVCWFGNDSFARILKTEKGKYDNYLINEDLYKFIFIDGNTPLVHNENMKKELLDKSIYKRWTNLGTFYGTTRYSFTTITDLSEFNKDVIRTHVETIYSEMAVLLLVQRSELLNFSNRIVEISREIKNNLNEENILKVKNLQSDFLEFVSTMYFTEVTPQDQGIELFDMMRQDLRLDQTLNEIRTEINELFNYVDLNFERNSAREMEKLTKLGAIFLPLTLITGIWGMNIYFLKKFNENIFGNNEFFDIGITGLIFLFSGLVVVFFTKAILKKPKHLQNNDNFNNSIKKDILKSIKDPFVIIFSLLCLGIFVIAYIPFIKNIIRRVLLCIS